jgi:hypothetical protein
MACLVTRTLLAGALTLGLTLFVPRLAAANGRYPQAMQLSEDPSDGSRLWLMSTYGLLTSPDRGRTWSWICEEALGVDSSISFDPVLGVHQNGSVILGLLDGLKTSRDRGCDWTYATDALKEQFIVDLAVHARLEQRALVLLSYGEAVDGGVHYTNQVWETTDNSSTFSLLANALPSDVLSTTLDSAPSDALRLYISAQVETGDITRSPPPVWLRSRNGGKTWEQRDLPLRGDVTPYIAAVHPTDANQVYLRTWQRTTDNVVSSALLHTSDAGDTWREILIQKAPMLGFALSPDGSTVLAGYGDPQSITIGFAPDALGIWRATAPDFNFERVFDKSINCLTWSEHGVYACSQLHASGFDVGLSRDQGSTFTAVQNHRTVLGPLACGRDAAVGALCTDHRWAMLCDLTLDCEPPAADAGPTTPVASKDEANCGCIVRGLSVPNSWLAIGIGLALLGTLRRRAKVNVYSIR